MENGLLDILSATASGEKRRGYEQQESKRENNSTQRIYANDATPDSQLKRKTRVSLYWPVLTTVAA